MDLTHATRRRLLDILVVGGAAAIVGAALQTGCGKVVLDGATGAGVGGMSGVGGAGTTAGIGGLGGGGGAGCALTTTGTSGMYVETTECFEVPAGGCPSVYHASMYIVPQGCYFLVSVDCGPVAQGSSCCYLTREEPASCTGAGG
jgi:hypothetical protein